MDMGISIAATNAASAANNVTQNLNTAINQLQRSVEEVEGVAEQISSSGDGNSVDLSKLSASVTGLEGTAKSPGYELTPMIQVLQTWALMLR